MRSLDLNLFQAIRLSSGQFKAAENYLMKLKCEKSNIFIITHHWTIMESKPWYWVIGNEYCTVIKVRFLTAISNQSMPEEGVRRWTLQGGCIVLSCL